jgi:hypothetical protein
MFLEENKRNDQNTHKALSPREASSWERISHEGISSSVLVPHRGRVKWFLFAWLVQALLGLRLYITLLNFKNPLYLS